MCHLFCLSNAKNEQLYLERVFCEEWYPMLILSSASAVAAIIAGVWSLWHILTDQSARDGGRQPNTPRD